MAEADIVGGLISAEAGHRRSIRHTCAMRGIREPKVGVPVNAANGLAYDLADGQTCREPETPVAVTGASDADTRLQGWLGHLHGAGSRGPPGG